MTDFCGNYPLYIYYLLSSVDILRYAAGTGVPTLNRNDLHSTYVTVNPCYKEQIRIAEILTAADERLSAERERLRKLEDIKHGLMNDLLTNRVSTDKLQGGV